MGTCAYCGGVIVRRKNQSISAYNNKKYCSKRCFQMKRIKDLGISLCYYCKNARPSKCAWIAEKQPVYAKAETKRKSISAVKEEVVDVVIVRECDHFEEVQV